MRSLPLIFLALFPALSLAVTLALPRGPAFHSTARVHYVVSPGGNEAPPREGEALLARTGCHLELRWGTHRLALALDAHGYPGTFFAPPELADKDLDLGKKVLFALIFIRELKGDEKGADLLGPTRVQWSDPYVARTERGLFTSAFGPGGELLRTEGHDNATSASHKLTLSGWKIEPGALEFAGLEPVPL